MPVAVGAPSMFNIRTWLIRVEGLLLIAFLYHTNGNLISTWQCLGTNKFASFTWPQIFYCSVHVKNITILFLYVNINCDYHLRYIIHKKDKCFCVITVQIVFLTTSFQHVDADCDVCIDNSKQLPVLQLLLSPSFHHYPWY